jgi:hypothetical protein
MQTTRSSETSGLIPFSVTPRNTAFFILTAVETSILHSINWLGSVAETKVSPVRYELGIHIPEGGILHSHRRENLKSYIVLTDWTL